MVSVPPSVRKYLAWSHLWLGVIGGLFFCLMGVTGTLVTFRPQIASFLSPSPKPAQCQETVDWNRAQQQIETAANSKINRIYSPSGADPRYHIRMLTGTDAIYTHVIYDACAGVVLGTINYKWMDWVVDLHHNLLAGKQGRLVAGAFGAGLLLSSGGGLLLWFLSRPSLRRLFRFQLDAPVRKTTLDVHRSVGIAAVCLLLLQSFTGLWLCYPQAMRGALAWFAPVQTDVRPVARPRPGKNAPLAGLNELMVSAQQAIPDGRIREIRMPDGYGNVQIRMWRSGDFRSLGNNVVTVDRSSAQVVATDLYSSKPGSNRFIQAMAGLHYGEWGGIAYRSIYGVTGIATAPLFLTGLIYWWLRRRRPVAEARPVRSESVDRSFPLEDRA